VTASASFEALGTTAVVVVTDRGRLARAQHLLREEIEGLDLACSRFRADSEISALNSSRGAPTVVSELFLEALDVALRAADLTGGIVTPTVGRAMRAIGYDRDYRQIDAVGPATVWSFEAVPSWQLISVDRGTSTVRVPSGTELDFGATAKAWCADRAAERIGGATGCGVLVSIGGDIASHGPTPPGGWVVQLAERHDEPLDSGCPRVSVSSGGVATSSTTLRRWHRGSRAMHHLVDARTGAPAVSVWRTVSIAAATCADANTASCAALILSEDAPSWLEQRGLPARLVRNDGRVEVVGGWPSDVARSPVPV
jgi:thiamine biosynthesis lipoprotein